MAYLILKSLQLNNTSEYDDSAPRETALEIAEEMGHNIKDFV